MNLGELEKQVLQYLWDHNSADVKQVYDHFVKLRGGSLNTIQSTMDRLFKKDLLTRHKIGHAWQYQPKVERHQLIGTLIKSVTSDFLGDDESSLIAAFSSMSEEFNDAQLDKLEALIEEQRQQRQQESK